MALSENVIRILARYSEGCRLAAEHGPTSGALFEYAYRNTPQGHGPVGRWIDRTFLQLSGSSGVSQRAQTTKDIVATVLQRRRTAGQSTVILDVACGTAPYLRELVREQGGPDLRVICHDRDPRRVMHGRKLARAEQVEHLTYSVGDATDPASYLTAEDPDIVIACGLFPILHRDDAVRTVLRLAFEHLAVGGTFVCTTIANPQARLSPWEGSFSHRPTVRSPEVVAGWLRATGFVGVEQRSCEPDGYALMGRKPDDP